MITHDVNGLRLSYDRTGEGPAVILLHGWPGDRTDYRAVVDRLTGVDVVVPDLRGFGASFAGRRPAEPAACGADAQADGIIALIDELDLHRPILGGYDIGSRIAQTVARRHPDLIAGLVVSPPLPGIGTRILDPSAQHEFWYQPFHQLDLAADLVDGRPDAVRTYLRHFWTHWSGPDFVLDDAHLDHLVAAYARPGAFNASVDWYRAGAGAVALSVAEQTPAPDQRITVPTTVPWPTDDPLFPPAWSDRLDLFFTDARVVPLDGAGHFVPVERPDEFAAALHGVIAR